MIDESVDAVIGHMKALIDPAKLLRNYKTIHKGTYRQVATKECTALTVGWDGTFDCTTLRKLPNGSVDVEFKWGIDLATWVCSPLSPDQAEADTSTRLIKMESDGSMSGLKIALLELTSFKIQVGPASLAIKSSYKYHGTHVQKLAETGIYQSQAVITLELETIANTRSNT